MRYVSEKKIVEEIKTHILCSATYFFFLENRAVYGMWKNTVQQKKKKKKKKKGNVHPCTGTGALYRPYGPQGK